MKKSLLISLFASICLFASAQGVITIGGTEYSVDTLSHKIVGPGNVYTYIRIPGLPIEAHIMTLDMTNKNNKIETYLARDSVSGTELITSACKRFTYDGHDAYCGINGDFFNVAGHNELPMGAPRGGSIGDGMIHREPRNIGDWAFATIAEDGLPVLDLMQFRGHIESASHGSYEFQHINIPKSDSEHSDITFFNRYAGKVTRQDENYKDTQGADKTEVFIKLCDGEKWGVNYPVKCVVTKIINNKGSNPLAEDECVLSGTGFGKEYLDKYAVGDEVTVTMNIVSQTTNTYPKITEMIGGNAVILHNNELTDRNENDSYNNVYYPRTGVATSADRQTMYLMVIDGRQTRSRGVTTAEMCNVFQWLGATEAVGFDGGGSAEMIVKHKVANYPSDGTERAVGNGWLVVSTAPSDNEVASLQFDDYKIKLAAYSKVTPKVTSLNKYNVILEEDCKDVTYTCSDNIGTISSDGKVFCASGKAGIGTLTAHYNGISTTKVVTVDDATFALDMDVVIMDKFSSFPIRITGTTTSAASSVDPAAFEWSVDDNSICTITDGVITAVANGETMAHGTLGDVVLNLKIMVETANAEELSIDKFTNLSDWQLKGSAKVTNISFSSNELPTELKYTYSGTNRQYVQIVNEMPLFGLPKEIKVSLNTGNGVFNNIVVDAKAYNASAYKQITFTDIPTNSDYELVLKLSDVADDITDRASFPIYFKGLKFNILNSHPTGENTITLNKFTLVYDNYEISAVDLVTASKFSIYPNPVANGKAYLRFNDCSDGEAKIAIYNEKGSLIRSCIITTIGNKADIDLNGIAQGVYFVKANINGQTQEATLIVK